MSMFEATHIWDCDIGLSKGLLNGKEYTHINQLFEDVVHYEEVGLGHKGIGAMERLSFRL